MRNYTQRKDCNNDCVKTLQNQSNFLKDRNEII